LENVDKYYDHSEYFTDIWDILRTFGIFYDHLVYFVAICYTVPHFGMLYQEKSGSSGLDALQRRSSFRLEGDCASF
jgi:hypothetical protein